MARHRFLSSGTKARHRFLSPGTKARLKAAVEAVERVSAAEVVLAVRPWSSVHRHAECLVGAVLAYLGLAYMMYADRVFSYLAILINTVLLFGLGALFTALFPPLRMLLTGRRKLDRAVEQAARAAFYELNVGSTRDRSGILIYVSLLERRCRVVEDVGIRARIDAASCAASWASSVSEVEAAVREGGVGAGGADRLARAVEALGPLLQKALPRREDDVNELPDLAVEDAS